MDYSSSKWQYVTSASYGGGFGIGSTEKGHFILKSPKGAEYRYEYWQVGMGPSIGLKYSLSGSLEALPSYGGVYISSSLKGKELAPHDFEGAAGFINVSATMLSGIYGSLVIFGTPGNTIASQVLIGLTGTAALTESKAGRDAIVKALTVLAKISGATATARIIENNKNALSNTLRNSSKGIIVAGGQQVTLGIVNAGVTIGLGMIWR
jgi:hypothetical protein